MFPEAPDPSQEASRLRRLMRTRRRGLRPSDQRAAARRLCIRLGRLAVFRKARRIAFYLAADGEIDPAPIRRLAARSGKQVCLPLLHPLRPRQLAFVALRPGDPLRTNRFGIPEPASLRRVLRAWQLDLVLVPLVAFDSEGNRLGMGGGYYDRAFAASSQAHWPRRPRLVGLAHRFQRVARLAANPWDVSLDEVITD